MEPQEVERDRKQNEDGVEQEGPDDAHGLTLELREVLIDGVVEHSEVLEQPQEVADPCQRGLQIGGFLVLVVVIIIVVAVVVGGDVGVGRVGAVVAGGLLRGHAQLGDGAGSKADGVVDAVDAKRKFRNLMIFYMPDLLILA